MHGWKVNKNKLINKNDLKSRLRINGKISSEDKIKGIILPSNLSFFFFFLSEKKINIFIFLLSTKTKLN